MIENKCKLDIEQFEFIKKWLKNNNEKYSNFDIYYYAKMLCKMGLDLTNDFKCRKGCIDLHIHSNISDGLYDPKLIVLAADYLGLSVISITDHNSLLYYKDNKIICNVNILPGLEINTILGEEKIHLLCYGKNLIQNNEFLSYLEIIQKHWNLRYIMAIEKINKYYSMAISSKIAINNRETINNELFRNHLKSQVSNISIENILKQWDNKLFLYEKSNSYLPNTLNVIEAVVRCGGFPYLAHCNILLKDKPEIINLLKSHGLHGLEALHPAYTREESIMIIKSAKKYGLHLSGGSDYHGNNTITIGKGNINNKNWRVPSAYYYNGICKQNGIIISSKEKILIDELNIDEKISLLIHPNCDIIYGNINNGVVFGRVNKDNITTEKDLYECSKEVLMSNNHPILININQEGGRLNTINWSWDDIWPGNNALGCINNWDLIKKCFEGMANELKALGITWNLAPVVDVQLNPNNTTTSGRCFGNDFCKVAKYVNLFIKTMQKSGIATTAKHFPGIGPLNVDIHKTVPHLSNIDESNLVPFYSAIEAKVASIMISNVVIDDIDNLPAFMSYKVVTELLRKKMKYDGVVITENISIPSLATYKINMAQAAVKSLIAGCDIVLFEPDITKEHCDGLLKQEEIKKTIYLRQSICTAVKNAVTCGQINRERFYEALKHVEYMYNTYGMVPSKLGTFSEFLQIKKSNQKLKYKVAMDSVKMFSNNIQCELLDNLELSKNILIFQICYVKNVRADSSYNHDIKLKNLANKYFYNCDILYVSSIDDFNNIKLSNYDVIIGITYNSYYLLEQKEIIKFLHKYFSKMVIIGMGADDEKEELLSYGIPIYISAKNMNAYALEAAFEILINR